MPGGKSDNTQHFYFRYIGKPVVTLLLCYPHGSTSVFSTVSALRWRMAFLIPFGYRMLPAWQEAKNG